MPSPTGRTMAKTTDVAALACSSARTAGSVKAMITSGLATTRLRNERVQPVSITVPAQQLNGYCSAVLVSERLQRCKQNLDRSAVWRSTVQNADAAALLRARRERPCRRATEQRDEVAALQPIKQHAVPHQPGQDCRIPISPR